MRRPDHRKPSPQASAVPRLRSGYTTVFFLLFFFYVCFRIEPAVEYHHSSPVFRLTSSFLQPFLTYPGGLRDYAAAFFSQLNYYNWLGALVFTVIGGGVFLGSQGVAADFSGRKIHLAPIGLAFLLLLSREQYEGAVLAMSLGLCLAVVAAWCYLRVVGRLKRFEVFLGLVLCWVLSGGIFYIVGAWSCLLFLILMGFFQILKQGQAIRGVFSGVPVLLVIFGMWWLGQLNPTPLINPGNKGSLVMAWTLYLLLPIECVVCAFLMKRSERGGDERRRTRPKQKAVLGLKSAESILALIVFALGWAVVWQGLASSRKRVAEIDYYSGRRDDEKVLAVAGRVKREQMDFATESRLHLALYHLGKLGEDVFAYRNQSAWDLLPGLSAGLDSCRAQSRTLFELGLVSESEHLAHEALENEGERPELLRLLAQVNVLKERPQAARIFLNVLCQVPFQKSWAAHSLRDLDRDPHMSDRADLASIRSLMLTNDVAHQAFPAESILDQLLHRNPTNQMAFEYLMAEYLMNLELNKLVDRLWQLEDFQYVGIPRHYEEALLLYEQSKGTRVELRGRKIRPETVDRFRRFNAAMEQRLFSTNEGRQALARDFGDTYWYYYVARRNQGGQS